MNFKIGAFFCVIVFSLSSCYNDPQFLGNNLIPENDVYSVKTDTLFEISAYTQSLDSLNTYMSQDGGVFGYVNSEIFGSTKASFVGRFLPVASTEGFGGPTAKPDSLIFYFLPISFYGDSSLALNIKVHELLNLSITDKNLNGLKSIDGNYNPDPFISTTFTGGKELKYSIDTSYARLLMDSVALADTTVFFDKFKGFYITCDDLPGYGGVAYPITNSSFYMVLYYHYSTTICDKDTVLSKSKSFSFYQNYFYNFSHDFTKASPTKTFKYLNDTLKQDTVFYTQNLGGVYGKIKLDGIQQWADSMPVIIHRAELIIGKDSPQTITPDSLAEQLLFRYKIEDEWAGIIYDQAVRNSANNGKIRLYSQDYNLNITTHLQRILEGEIKDKSIYVFPSLSNNISRVVLQSGTHSRKIKLRITYTKLR